MVCSSSGMPVVSRKTGKSCQLSMKTFTVAVILRRIYSVRPISASRYLRETHCDNAAFKHQGLLSSRCLQLRQAEHPESSKDPVSQAAWVQQLLPTHFQKFSKFPISHRPLTTMPCQMHFLTLLSISCQLPANNGAKCDHKIFINPRWQGCVAAKNAVDTELEALSLDYPFFLIFFKSLQARLQAAMDDALPTAWLPM